MKNLKRIIAVLLLMTTLASCGKALDNTSSSPLSADSISSESTFVPGEKTVLVINCADFDIYERTLVTAVQGIVNRDGPKIYLLTEKSSWINTIDRLEDGSNAFPEGFTDKYALTGTEGAMLDEFTRLYGFELKEVTLNEAIEIYKDKFAGLIEYDISLKDTDGQYIANPARTNAVMTAAGVYTCLPVTPTLMRKYPALEKYDTLINMKGKFTNRLQATKWAADTLLDKCSTKFVASYFYEGENGTFQADYAIMNKAFCYELAAVLPENLDHVLGDGSIDRDIYDPTEAAILSKILEHVDDYGFVWGWGLAGENGQASTPAIFGLELICANMPNGSFFSQITPDRTDFAQKNLTNPNDVKVENKMYIAFMTNEGDSYKALVSLQNYGSWLQNARGKLPINWGIDPLVFDLFPALADYYLTTASPMDQFFFSAAGYGYIHPAYQPAKMHDGYAELVKQSSEKYGVDYADIWWFTMFDENGNEVQWEWFKKTGLKGITLWSSEDRTIFESGIPAICSSLYYVDEKIGSGTRAYKAKVVADTLKKARNGIGKKTFCTVIYGGTPEYFYNIAKDLPESDFEIVPLDKLYMIAEKTGESISGYSASFDIEGNMGAWDPTAQE